MSRWGWRSGRTHDSGRLGPVWVQVSAAVVPYVTLGFLLLMFHFIGGTMTMSKGVLFDLPATGVGDGAVTEVVALIVPMRHETLVFFDDSRYVIGSAASMRAFEEHLSERLSRCEDKTLLVLADRRVSCGDLMGFAARVRKNGVSKVLFAEKNRQEASD